MTCSVGSARDRDGTMKKPSTSKQGQCLAFISDSSKIHGRAPAEAQIQQHFQVSPPAAHQRILTLEARGLVEPTPGRPRSVRLLIPPSQLPTLA